jgi:hypothetical protein
MHWPPCFSAPTSATRPDASVSQRLPTHVEVASILRRAAVDGDFATVMKRGDPDRGTVLLIVTSRGKHWACLERRLGIDGFYRWQVAGPGESAGSNEVQEFLRKQARFDEDSWAIELDIAQPERFIAETTSSG